MDVAEPRDGLADRRNRLGLRSLLRDREVVAAVGVGGDIKGLVIKNARRVLIEEDPRAKSVDYRIMLRRQRDKTEPEGARAVIHNRKPAASGRFDRSASVSRAQRQQ